MISFPAPILSVTADAVRDLQGGDALSGLWTLFTKCKESLQDGRRLENISWRLWYREMTRLKHADAQEHPQHFLFSEKGYNGDIAEGSCAIIDDTDTTLCPSKVSTERRRSSILAPVFAPSSPVAPTMQKGVSSSATAQPAFERPPSVRRNSSVGRIICDMLSAGVGAKAQAMPHLSETVGDESKATHQLPSPAVEITESSISTPPIPVINDNQSWPLETDTLPALRLPPSSAVLMTGSPFALEETEADGARSGTTTVTSSPVLSTSVYGRRRPSPTSASGPRVVVLTPTPNMTPHPTPPQTPVIGAQTPKCADSEPRPPTPTHEEQRGAREYLLPSAAIGGSSISRPRTRASVSPPESHSSSAYSSSGSSVASPSTATSYPLSPSPTLTTFDVPQYAPAAVLTSASAKTPQSTDISTATTRSPQTTLRPSDRRFFLQQSPDTDLSSERDESSVWNSGNGPHETTTSPGIKSDTETQKDTALEAGSVRSDVSHLSTVSKTSDVSGVTSDVSRVSKSNRKPKLAARTSHGKRLGGLQRPPIPRQTSLVSGPAKGKQKTSAHKIEMTPAVLPNRRSTSSADDVNARAAQSRKVSLETKAPPKRPTFNIGSGSSGSKRGESSTRVSSGKPTTSKSTSNLQVSRNIKSSPNLDVNSTLNAPILPSKNRKTLILELTSSESGSWTGSESFSDTSNISAHPPSAHSESNDCTENNANVGASPNNPVEDDDEDWASDESSPEAQKKPEIQQTQQQRAEQQRQAALAREQRAQTERERRAEEERERDRGLFAKAPKRSYSQNVINQRTRSGLLSQLLNPNPTIFPQGHPYRVQSGVDLHLAAGKVVGGLSATRMSNPQPTHGNATVQSNAHASGSSKPSGLRTSKSTASVTLDSVNAESSSWVGSVYNHLSPTSRPTVSNGSGGRRPPDVEYDTESGDDEDDEQKKNVIQVSESLAHRKLAAFAGRMNLKGQTSDRVNGERPPSAPGGYVAPGSRPPIHRAVTTHANGVMGPPPVPNRPTAPIGLPPGHPYTLPPAPPPSTPRTTRRAMLQTEMSESVRRNLLWERRSAVTTPLKRGSSTGNVLSSGLGMTRLPSVVQLTAKTTNGTSTKPSDPDNFEEDGRTHGERAAHKRAMARNRSWGDDYHTSGW